MTNLFLLLFSNKTRHNIWVLNCKNTTVFASQKLIVFVCCCLCWGVSVRLPAVLENQRMWAVAVKLRTGWLCNEQLLTKGLHCQDDHELIYSCLWLVLKHNLLCFEAFMAVKTTNRQSLISSWKCTGTQQFKIKWTGTHPQIMQK